MNIYFGAPFLILAIYFNLIELSSQYNTEVLKKGHLKLPDNKSIYYIKKNNKKVEIKNGKNRETDGLLDKHTLVCAFEKVGKKILVHKLMVNDKQVKSNITDYTVWSDEDTELYEIYFEEYL
ncbi:uncharacterized protein LOC117172451 [Belonocnema kinseyi]|uniref:uncharacterized protein LOC117172451 n=1 Tax=Belonocnema kinseyi TaxID=2817044 RepID=UPI00143D7E4A|nr:uncharacterized protein LOC117172451 [Belonocnema kinseyi]